MGHLPTKVRPRHAHRIKHGLELEKEVRGSSHCSTWSSFLFHTPAGSCQEARGGRRGIIHPDACLSQLPPRYGVPALILQLVWVWRGMLIGLGIFFAFLAAITLGLIYAVGFASKNTVVSDPVLIELHVGTGELAESWCRHVVQDSPSHGPRASKPQYAAIDLPPGSPLATRPAVPGGALTGSCTSIPPPPKHTISRSYQHAPLICYRALAAFCALLRWLLQVENSTLVTRGTQAPVQVGNSAFTVDSRNMLVATHPGNSSNTTVPLLVQTTTVQTLKLLSSNMTASELQSVRKVYVSANAARARGCLMQQWGMRS